MKDWPARTWKKLAIYAAVILGLATFIGPAVILLPIYSLVGSNPGGANTAVDQTLHRATVYLDILYIVIALALLTLVVAMIGYVIARKRERHI